MLFRQGDKVEFFSSDKGGIWKSGVVEKHANAQAEVRINVGNNVFVCRKAEKVRLVTAYVFEPFEKLLIEECLVRNFGVLVDTAAEMGFSVSTLKRRIKQYGICG